MKKHPVASIFFACVAACLLLSLAGSNASTAASPSLRYRIDAGKSRFIVQVFRSGIFKVFAHDHTIQIRDFSGEALITPGSLSPASLQLTIRADSLSVIDKVSDSDRREIEATMRNQVLETAKYPEITFKATQIEAERRGEGDYTARIWGELTLHGVTKGMQIVSRVEFGDNIMRATGNFTLKQTDYKITPVSVAGGTVRVKDEIKFTFDIAALRQ
ncbi:MAG: YceI family protein [Acidobacteriota bacterium]